jgi:formylglycine-generating enzyme required for sulfatase activity
VVYVSWFDAARFANWLANGQGGGSTETGAYTLNGATNGIILANVAAQVYIPSQNEWYKAAYYNGATSTYSLYPNGQNSITTADANYNSSGSTDVGTYSGDPSMYGTFDQGGNVHEWNDLVLDVDRRGLQGGAYGNPLDIDLASTSRGALNPIIEYEWLGFRVASVPEPTSMLLTMVAGGMMLTRRKR